MSLPFLHSARRGFASKSPAAAYFDNKRNEAMYVYTDYDSQLKQPVGESSYAVTVEKGQLPP